MHDTDTPTTTDDIGIDDQKTLAVYPIADYPENNLERLMDESLRPEDTIDLYGHCAAFCADDRQPSGLTVAEHGPWCESLPGADVRGRDAHGERVDIYARLTSLYTHGVYRRSEMHSDLDRWHNRFVRLSVGGGDDEEDQSVHVVVSIGEVRRLAAGLVFLADTADRVYEDLNESVVRRRR